MAPRLKAARRRQIEALLRSGRITSQAELASELSERGLQVTQATLSRDLEEMGAYKARGAGGPAAYRLPDEPPAAELERMLAEFVTRVEASGNLVVLRTPPGSAAPVARAIDSTEVPGVIGTIAGDDTILVVCAEKVRGSTVAARFERGTR